MADYQQLHDVSSVSDFCKPFAEETFKQIGSLARLVVLRLACLESNRADPALRGPQ
jgi:hypothetical protein